MADGASNRPLNEPDKGPLKLPATVTPGTVVAREPYGSIGGYGTAPFREEGGSLRETMFEYLRIVSKRKWLILAVTLSVLSIGAVRTLMMTPLYTTTARLQIDRDAVKVVEGGNISAPSLEGSTAEFMRTQYELLHSFAMAQRVASLLKLGEDADMFKPRGGTIFGFIRELLSGKSRSANPEVPVDIAARENKAASIVAGSLQVRPVIGSRLVDVLITDPSPARAQRIANAYAEAFIASNVDKRFEANAFAKTFLEDQLKQLKLRLEESERALLDFAGKAEIIQVSENSSIAETNLASANAALSALISERIKSEQLWRQLETADGINLPQILSNSVIDGLRAKRNALVTEYQEKLETFKPGYPLMVQINDKIRTIDRQLASEVRAIRSSLKAGFESSAAQEQQMRARVEGLKTEVLELQKKMISHSILKREVDTNSGLYSGLLQRYKEIDVASGVVSNTVFVIDRAGLPGSPSSPHLQRTLMLALGLGLGIGFSLALLLEKLDDRIHTLSEMERTVGLPTLGIIPKVTTQLTVEAELIKTHSSIAESYRSLATALQFSTPTGTPRTLLVTSSGPGEGKSITSMAIARHFATTGSKVLLIDADLRNPSMHKKLAVENNVGLSNYLTGALPPQETFQATDITTLAFMASGPIPPNPADLLSSPRLHSLLSVGLEVFDLIVIDGPPVIGLADAQLLANAANATIFVVAAGQARAGLVRGSLQRLQLARAILVGSVFTKLPGKNAGYGYDYQYGSQPSVGFPPNAPQLAERGARPR